jgi:hypothetical protein
LEKKTGIELDNELASFLESGTENKPAYSTTWEGVGKLAVALKEEGLMFSLQLNEEGYEASVFDGYEADSIYHVHNADDAPEALALAALHALHEKKSAVK